MRQIAILAAFYLCSGTAFAADPQLLNLVMPDAGVLAGVNITTAKTSPFGQFLLARLAARPLPPFIAATGFDPRSDLVELLFAGTADPSDPGGLVLARGTFNVTQIAAAVASSKNLSVQTYDGDTIIVTTNPNAKVQRAVAFIGTSIAVAGDVTSVKAALDRSSGVNPITDAALATEVNSLSASADAWIASSVGVPVRKASAKNQALKAIVSFEGGVTLGTDVQVTGQAVANSPQNASALAGVIQLLVTAAKNPAVNQVLQNLQVNVSDANLNLAISLPEAQVEALINGLGAQRQQARSSGQARRPAVH